MKTEPIGPERYNGQIKTFKKDRGFGFVSHNLPIENDLFFHFSSIEGGIKSPLYLFLTTQTSDQIYPPIQITFEVIQGKRGYQATNIRREESGPNRLEVLSSSISPAALTGDEFFDRFMETISMELLPTVDKDRIIKQSVISRIARTPNVWDELINVATLWAKANRIFTEMHPIWTKNEEEVLDSLAESIAKSLKFRPLPRFDGYTKIPAFVKPLAEINTPIRHFREAKELHLALIANPRALAYAVDSEHFFLNRTSTKILIAVLLTDDDDSILSSIRPSSGILLIHQQAIIKTFLNGHLPDSVVFGRTFRDILPTSLMQPYEVGSSYNPMVFVGRAREREGILEKPDSNYAIYGGRKIGKTWFLKNICNLCEYQPYNSTYVSLYVSLQSAENIEDACNIICDAVQHRMGADFESAARDPLIRLSNTLFKVHRITKKTVLVAIDEIDDVLKMKEHYSLFGKLRQLQETYPMAFKYVFAGFKELIQAFSDEKSNNPFANWIGKKHLPLGCLQESELQSLIIEPLMWVGLEFNPHEIVDKVFELTSGHPYYAQTLCHSVVNARLRNNANTLDAKNIDKQATEDFFNDIFDMFIANLSNLQMLIGIIYSDNEDSFTDSDISNLLRHRFQIEITEKEVRSEMKILQACSVFIRSDGGYRPLMQRINREFFSRQDDIELAVDYLDYLESIHGTKSSS